MSKIATLFDIYETNEKLESDGVWHTVEIGLDDKNPRFLGRRITLRNAKLREVSIKRRADKKKQLAIKHGLLPADEQREDELLDFCEGILVDWENVTDRDGKRLKFTIENAFSLLKACPDLFTELDAVFSARETFQDRAEELEEDAKN